MKGKLSSIHYFGVFTNVVNYYVISINMNFFLTKEMQVNICYEAREERKNNSFYHLAGQMKTSGYSFYKSEKFRGKLSTCLQLSVYLWFAQYNCFINIQCIWHPQKPTWNMVEVAVVVVQSLSCVRLFATP